MWGRRLFLLSGQSDKLYLSERQWVPLWEERWARSSVW